MSRGMQMSTTLHVFVSSLSSTLMSRGTQTSTTLHVLFSLEVLH